MIKEKLKFRNQEEEDFYIMSYAAYLSKVRALKNIKKTNRIFIRKTSLADCIQIARERVNDLKKGHFFPIISLQEFKTYSLDELIKKYTKSPITLNSNLHGNIA